MNRLWATEELTFRAQYFNDVMRSSKGHADPVLLKYVVGRSMDYAEFAYRHGVRWWPPSKQHGVGLHYMGGGQGLVNHYYQWLERRSDRCRVVYSAEIVRIDAPDGEFKSLDVIINGQERITLSADNLILATGGDLEVILSL